MCIDTKPKVDRTAQFQQQNAAEEARIREAVRQQQLDAGFASLDALFGGGSFDPNDTLRSLAEIVNNAQSFGPTKGKNVPQRVDLTPGIEGDTLDDIDFSTVENVLDLFQLPSSLSEADRGLFGRDQLPGAGQFAGIEPAVADFESNLREALLPQFERQQQNAAEQNVFSLARAGLSADPNASTISAERQVDLNADAQLGLQTIDSEVAQQSDAFRGSFADLRSGLETSLLATGDAQRAGQRATSELAQLFRKRPTVSPLGDVFASSLGAINQANQGRQVGQIAQKFGVDLSPFGGGSGTLFR